MKKGNREGGAAGWRTVEVMGRECQVIEDTDALDAFFISVVSPGDHWIFLSSRGGITAGRRNPDSALFPYYTEDKVVDLAESTGAHAMIRIEAAGPQAAWEPFSIRGEGRFEIRRSLYKSLEGDMAAFEEENRSLGLVYRYAWMTSARYGIVKRVELENIGKEPVEADLLDGIRNILPAGSTSQLQNEFSCLMDAYKSGELLEETGLALYSLSSVLTDKAEPSEALRATVAWSPDADARSVLLCEDQVSSFRGGGEVASEARTRAKRGAYYVRISRRLAPGGSVSWRLVADVEKTQAEAAALDAELAGGTDIGAALEADILRGCEELKTLVGLADGFQAASSRPTTVHHYANTLFNIMRGGIFADGYRIDREDFRSFLAIRNAAKAEEYAEALGDMPEVLDHRRLEEWAGGTGDIQLKRLTDEYLPLSFSRRHGDPSRPWNRFSIELEGPDGRKSTSYQGNWRDIFQNWEALGLSFPEYVPSMAAKFLNAVTPDGYNPYRVTREGIEWEVPEPGNPWANIGYWGDHQVIYLLKLLEWQDRFEPGVLAGRMDEAAHSHADVPYRIKPYADIIVNPKDTIVFDAEADEAIAARTASEGSDGRLVRNAEGGVLLSTLLEKLLIILLAKLSNFVPGGGLWMNTQRPEWNDANNALVGQGLSMVTLCYLRRFACFLRGRLGGPDAVHSAARPLAVHFREVLDILGRDQPAAFLDPVRRRELMDALGSSATRYREAAYDGGLAGEKESLPVSDVAALLDSAVAHADATLAVARRPDGLFHSYNLLVLGEGTAEIRPLYEMLEGQVAVLSSGFLDARGSLDLLDALAKSALYREDQHSYMLYPNRRLPRFLEKNLIPTAVAEGNPLLKALINAGDSSVVVRDPSGDYRFHADFRNAGCLAERIDSLAASARWGNLAETQRGAVLDIYEEVFDHSSFTGRSGTFFAYEGLGSIYWHMVSKLLLAVQEAYQSALDAAPDLSPALAERYFVLRSGLSCHKTPEEYGAFVTDPYSHTPSGSGAKQPGMTGQVKEELLTRLGELGVRIEEGRIAFLPGDLIAGEYLDSPKTFDYISAAGEPSSLEAPKGSVMFTYCGVPIRYESGGALPLTVRFSDGAERRDKKRKLTREESLSVFRRESLIDEIVVAAG